MIRYVLLLSLAALVVLGFVVGKEKLHGRVAGATGIHESGRAFPRNTIGGTPLYIVNSALGTTARTPGADAAGAPAALVRQPIVVPDCRLAVCDKQDVPSQREGKLLFVGTELAPGEKPPSDQLLTITVGTETKTLRKLREGDVVRVGQLLAYLDDQLARDDLAIKQARVVASNADLQAALKSGEEAKNKFDIQQRLWQYGRAASEEEVRTAKLNWEKAVYDAVGKQEAVKLAERELSQAETLLRMHQIRAETSGIVKTIYKRRGEAVRAFEPVLQIHNLDCLRVEGHVDVEHLSRLKLGMTALVEPSRREGPQQTLVGHFQEVNCVAIASDGNRIVSGGGDCTLRVWDRRRQQELYSVPHPSAVRAAACSPAGSPTNLCLTGAADGKARLVNIDTPKESPRELFGQHEGAILCVAFSPDGRTCATGGDDRVIRLWDVALGALRYRLDAAHTGAITALHFTPQSRLVSAGRDNALRVWSLTNKGAAILATFDRRSGEVAQLGVSADGQRALYDEPGGLRVVSLADGRTEGQLQHPSGIGFSLFAYFSPDGGQVLTAGEGGLHLWRIAASDRRTRELRHWVAPANTVITCAAFAADGSCVVAGTRDRRLLIWRLPLAAEAEERFTATVSLLEHAEEAATRQVRIWAELPNPRGALLPGTTATLVVP